jgi:hypothetical protein
LQIVSKSTAPCASARARGHGLSAARPRSWGNRIEIVGYDNIQFTKADNVLRGMGLSHLEKNASALKELKEKNMEP